MKTTDPVFEKLLSQATEISATYVHYSPAQINQGAHLKNDPTIGERAWNIPKTTGEFLYRLITQLELSTGLELGTSVGYSTLWISAGLSENNADWSLVTTEKNPEKSALAKNMLSDIFSDHIHFETTLIADFLPQLSKRSFDIIFMDADRGNYELYWNYLKNFLHKKSIVVIDNASRNQHSVHQFQELLKNDSSLSTYLHPIDNGLLLVTLSNGNYSDIQKILNNLL